MTTDFRLSRNNVLAIIKSKYKADAELLLTICEATNNPNAAISMLMGNLEEPKLNETSEIKLNARNPRFMPLDSEYASVRFTYDAQQSTVHYYNPAEYTSEEEAKRTYEKNPSAWINYMEKDKKYFYAWDGETYYESENNCSVESWNQGKPY